MKKEDDIHKVSQSIHRLSIFVLFLIVGLTSAVTYYYTAPDLPSFRLIEDEIDEEDWDRIEDGIHVRTGLVDAKGLMTVVNNCTNCHSSQLVIQNRMNRDRWKTTIRWMQQTQNLWELGEQEDIIIEYLVTNYPPTKKGRRQNLANIEWYDLED